MRGVGLFFGRALSFSFSVDILGATGHAGEGAGDSMSVASMNTFGWFDFEYFLISASSGLI